jgi:hypothetical protein
MGPTDFKINGPNWRIFPTRDWWTFFIVCFLFNAQRVCQFFKMLIHPPPPPNIRHWGLKTIKLDTARSCPHPLTMPWPKGHLCRKHKKPLPAPSNGKLPQGAQGSLPSSWPMIEGVENTSCKWCHFPPIGADESLLDQSEELPIWSYNFRDHSKTQRPWDIYKEPLETLCSKCRTAQLTE